LVIGAQKAGTTWFYANLRAHPGVWLPREKELHYFDEKRDRRFSLATRVFGREFASRRWRGQFRRQARGLLRDFSAAQLLWSLRYLLPTPNDAWYLSLFAPAAGRVTGDMTPAYSMLTEEEVEQVSRLLPEVKIVFFVRHPVERAWSHEVMASRQLRGGTAGADLKLLESHGSVLRTDYVRTLDVWSRFYPADRIFVAFLDDVHFHPEEVLARLTRFLDLPPHTEWPAAGRRIFQSRTSEMPAAAARLLADLYGPLTEELARRYGGHTDWWLYSTSRLRNAPDPVVHYPLNETPLWADWLGETPASAAWSGGVPPCQSSTLEELTTAPAVAS
jgi:hypothetical protein